MESRLRKASSPGSLSNSVIRVILHSECKTKGKMSVENIAKHAGTVMDTLFCAVGSVGSLELPLAQAGFHRGTSTERRTHHHPQRTRKQRNVCTQIISSLLNIDIWIRIWLRWSHNKLSPCFQNYWTLILLIKSFGTKQNDWVQSKAPLLQPEGYPANTPKRSFIEAAQAKPCIADLIHMLLTHMLCNINEQLGRPV